MNDRYHLSATETEIMELLWEQKGPVRQTQLLALFCERGKDWSRQTLNTMLLRLEKRNFVVREKRFVRPVYSREEFGKQMIEEIVGTYFGGDWKKMIAECKKRN